MAFWIFCLPANRLTCRFCFLPGLIRLIFIIFYDSSVVSKDGFEAWVQSDDNSEREGKVVAINSVISFLTWLKEEDIQSDQEIEG